MKNRHGAQLDMQHRDSLLKIMKLGTLKCKIQRITTFENSYAIFNTDTEYSTNDYYCHSHHSWFGLL